MATKITVPITLNLHSNEKGKLYIIPDHEDLERLIAAYDAELAEKKAEQAKEPDDKRIAYSIDALEREKAQRVGLRDKILPLCEKKTFSLNCPTYGELILLRAQPGVVTRNKQDVLVFDDEKFMDALLTRSVQGLSEQDVRDLHPDVATRLYQELKSLITPDAAEIPIPASQ